MTKVKSEQLAAFGASVREVRSSLRMSQEDLAARSEMDRTYIGGVERGERNISFINISRIAAALDIPISELIKKAER